MPVSLPCLNFQVHDLYFLEAMSSKSGKSQAQQNSKSDKENKIACSEMGDFCFETVCNALTNKTQMSNILAHPTFANDAYPVFVSWKTAKNALRGCIGTFSAMPLHEGLRQYSLQSAFKDTRFSPITLEELKTLSVGVSILTKFEICKSIDDWQIGVHGIQIKASLTEDDDASIKDSTIISATFLPEVAAEQGWTKTQTIDALLRKGGFKGDITDRIRKKISVTRYQSDKIVVAYQDYQKRCSSTKNS